MDDETPPWGRDRPLTIVNVPGRSRELVIQQNLEHLVTITHLENVMNDFQTKMVVVVQEQIKSNMLFFQVNSYRVIVNPLRGHSQEDRPGPSRAVSQEVSKRPTKERHLEVSEEWRNMEWKLLVRTQDNAHPNDDWMETDAREDLEEKKVATLQSSTLDPLWRQPSKTEGRSLSPLFRPREEKTVLQPMVYRRPGLAKPPLTLY